MKDFATLQFGILLCALFIGPLASAETWPAAAPAVVDQEDRYLAEIRLHTADELDQLLNKAELALGDGYGDYDPIVLVLHGQEAAVLTRDAYDMHKMLVDKAARLTAFRVVDIRVCETWMAANGVTRADLPPFVSTVQDGVEEESRLQGLGFSAF